jgi:hypothetical protein
MGRSEKSGLFFVRPWFFQKLFGRKGAARECFV